MGLIGFDNIAGQNNRNTKNTDQSVIIKESSRATFAEDVIQLSQKKPVLVDFWAGWCEPCKALTPILEEAVKTQKGSVALIKIDVDKNQALAAQFQIRSLPTIYAFFQGQPVDGFAGVLPPEQIQAFIEKLCAMAGVEANLDTDEDQQDVAQQAFARQDFETALQIYQQIWQNNPNHIRAACGIGRCLLGLGQIEQAEQFVASSPIEIAHHPEIEGLRAGISLLREATPYRSKLSALQETLIAQPQNHENRLHLALALFAAHQISQAYDVLLDGVAQDRSWQDEAFRKYLVRMFSTQPSQDSTTQAARRRLSSLLFV